MGVQDLIAWLTLLVLSATLIAVIAYTRAAFEQAEGAQKPCITISGELDDSDDAILENRTGRLHPTNDISLVNIGSGPAINLRFCFHEADEKAPPTWVTAPHLAPGQSTWSLRKPTVFRTNEVFFIATYQSLTGTRYESSSTIVDKKIVQGFRFAKVSRWAPWKNHSRTAPAP
ncbi:MAG: hypothetical protein ACRD1B_02950 [Thermoanaerobaculia bacterium]